MERKNYIKTQDTEREVGGREEGKLQREKRKGERRGEKRRKGKLTRYNCKPMNAKDWQLWPKAKKRPKKGEGAYTQSLQESVTPSFQMPEFSDLQLTELWKNTFLFISAPSLWDAVIWNVNAPHRSHAFKQVPLLVVIGHGYGIFFLKPCWRKWVTGDRFWEFKALPHFRFLCMDENVAVRFCSCPALPSPLGWTLALWTIGYNKLFP